MKIFFVRHGQSENNAIWADTRSNLNRVADPQLTEKGKKQVEAAADFLFSQFRNTNNKTDDQSFKYEGEVTRIYCSFMDRAIQTGLIISQKLAIPLNAHLEIHENGGLYSEDPVTLERTGLPGRNPKELQFKYPELILPKEINPDGWWNRPFEERETRRLRAKSVLSEIKIRYGNSEEILIVITHGGFYNYLLRAAFELKDDTAVWFELFNAAITLVEISEDFINLIYCNRYDFIPKEIIT
jgi:2,3-bisphosphoglycerate-dependent phosphoglycerate mutase